MLVGRDTELAVLDRHFNQMMDGQGSILFLTGEAGLGKTTLVRTWVSGIGSRGAENIAHQSGTPNSPEIFSAGRNPRDERSGPKSPQPTGQAEIPMGSLFAEAACSIPIGNIDVGELEALQPWADIVAQLQKLEQAPNVKGKIDLRKLIHESAPSWAWAIPLVGDIAHAALETSRLIKEQRGELDRNPNASNQQQVFQQYVNLLTKISEQSPLIIFLDDLHWADSSSINLLFYLSRQIADKKILVIATYRQDDAVTAQEGKGHPIITVKNEILRYKVGREVTLGYLSRNAIRELLETVFKEYQIDDKFERWLEKISDGNSLFVTQFIDTLREDGHLNAHGIFVGDYNTITTPSSALAVVEERTRRLDEGTRELLCYATAEGEEFTAYVLERLSERKPLELLKDLQRATKQGLIVEKGKAKMFANQTTSIFGFSHALFHKALYDSLIDAQKDYLHRACFLLLKTEWDRLAASKERTPVFASKLLTHAEQCGEWGTAAEVAFETAKGIWDTFAEKEALEMIGKTLAALDRTDGAPTAQDTALRAEALALRGKIDSLRGRYEAALQAYEDAAKLFSVSLRPERMSDMTCLKADVYRHMGAYDEAITIATRAMHDSDRIGYRNGEAAAHTSIGQVHQARGAYAEALENYLQSMQIKEALEDRGGVAVGHNNIGAVEYFRGQYEDALSHFAKSLALYEALGDRAGKASALNNTGLVHYARGAYEMARDYFSKSVAIVESIGDLASEASALENIGSIHYSLGEYDDALKSFRRSLEINHSLGNRAGEASANLNIGNVHEARGACDEALDHFAKSLGVYESLGNRAGEATALMLTGSVHALQGAHEQALAYFEKCLAIYESIGNRWGVARALNGIGAVQIKHNRRDDALHYAEKSLLIYEEIGDRWGEAESCLIIGEVRRKQDQLMLARSAIDRAHKLAKEIRSRALEGETICELGLLEESEALHRDGDARIATQHDAQVHLEDGVRMLTVMKSNKAEGYRGELERMRNAE